MKKRLEELTKQDWDTLFPIALVPHNPAWKNIFEAEKQEIIEKLGPQTVLNIAHFGSTSVPNLAAKPYIDILIAIPESLLFDKDVIKNLTSLGYHYFEQAGNMVTYMIFVKGYNLHGKNEQIFHIHMCTKAHELWDQVSFRDYLIANPSRAKSYEELKLKLASVYKNDRSGYRLAKSDFINETVKLAKEKVDC